MIKTTKVQIAQYWSEFKPEYNLTHTHCWRCGIKKRLDRCHILAQAIEGSDVPSNFVLLCKHCHIDSPNVENPEFIWEWLSHYRSRGEADLWYHMGIREYEALYQTNFMLEITGKENQFVEIFNEEVKKGTRHFGQPSLNPATVAGIIKEVINKLDR